MPKQKDVHGILFEQVACSVRSKPPGKSVEECFESCKMSLCKKDDKCRIFEKTEAQLRYVNSPINKNIFLTACPGSGKTEVVGLKAAYETRRWEQKRTGIAFLTFTNNATSVIRDRVIQFAGVDAVGYPHYIGTIDSWLHRFIAHPFAHRETDYFGEEGDGSIRIVENSSNAGFLNNFQTKYAYNRRGKIKANQYYFDLSTGDVKFWSGDKQLDIVRNGGKLEDWQYRDLEKAKKRFLENGFATYQDIEQICHRILSTPEILRQIASRFPFIIIDECQDLSKNQLVLISQLLQAGVWAHFVGDLDQSIYSFKDVYPSAIKEFVQDNGFSSQTLVENFRSPQPIVDLCSMLVNKAGDIGRRSQANDPMCVYLIYTDEADMATLPEKFSDVLDAREDIDAESSAILARNYSIIGKIRAHCNFREKKIAYFPATAINAWNNQNRSLEQTEEAMLLMGKYLAEKLFSSESSNSRYFYCPESVSSPIQWRVFLARVLSACCDNTALVDLQQTWGEWGKSFREKVEEILDQSSSGFDSIMLPENINGAISYKVPRGESKEVVSAGVEIFPNRGKKNIRITTFHKVKGETLDAALVVSSRTMQGGGGGHWQKWVEDPANENARFAYVASSRPRHLLAWAVSAQSLENNGKTKLEELGFVNMVVSNI